MIKKIFKSFTFIILTSLGLVGLERIYFHYTGDFSLSNINFAATPFKPDPTQEQITEVQREELSQVVAQRFSFLGKGNQCYAFLSADGRYVLKFFKFGHLKDSWYQDLFRNREPISRLKRFKNVFAGYELAYRLNRENSGLLFTHLNKSDNLNLQVQLKDALGFSYTVDLDSFVFVLQEKAQPTKELLSSYLNQGDVEGAKERLKQLIALYKSEYKQGLYDRDHNVLYNTGFTKTRAIRFDVGKLRAASCMQDPTVHQEDLKKIVFERLAPWFRKHYPAHQLELVNALEESL